MADPEVILLDEPAAGVNPTLLELIIDRIVDLNRAAARTILLIEHNMDMVARLCGRVVVMAQGSLLARGRAGRGGARPGGDRGLSRGGGMSAGPALATEGLVAGYERDLPIVRGVDFAVAHGRTRRGARAEWRRQVHLRQGDRRARADPFGGTVALGGRGHHGCASA